MWHILNLAGLLLAILVMATSAVDASEVCASPGCLASGDSLSFLQASNAGVAGRHSAHASQPQADEEARILQLIDEGFASVPPSDGQGPELSERMKEIEATFSQNSYLNECLDSTVISKSVADPDLLPAIYEQVGILNSCRDGPVCEAIKAAQRTLAALEGEFSKGPKFVNSMVVNWAGTSNPSWREGTVQLNATGSARIIDGNGANAYALCEITRVIVQNTPHQQGSQTCGWTSLLEQAILNQPAELFMVAVRLLWTGRVSSKFSMPCEAVFNAQVGLAQKDSRQVFGLEWMWTSSLLSSNRQQDGLSCEDVPQFLYVMGNPKQAQVSQDFEESIPAEIAHTAELLYGKKPAVLTDWNRVCPAGADQEPCRKVLQSNVFPYGALHAMVLLKEGSSWTQAMQDPSVALTSKELSQVLGAPETQQTFTRGAGFLLKAMTEPGLSSNQLSQACEAADAPGKGVSLMVNAALMFGEDKVGPNTGSCDHWVVIAGCPATLNSTVTIWTWGWHTEIPVESVMDNTCDFLVMDVKL